MYQYDDFDRQLVRERAAQFRNQTRRFLAGDLTEEEFRPLRLQNGLYVQRFAPMLRIAVPYGLLSSEQLRKLAHIARTYDKGYGHFTTRQNLQFNWPALERVPDILDELAEVEMHAIQTSGNCIRNITSDHFAGIAPDELEDPRPYCELLRQWSTFHPEFAYLPRKFKIAVSATTTDRAAIRVHDIGLQLVENEDGERGFQVFVGGGLGRTPVIGQCIREFLPFKDLLSYLEAILRVYNSHGNRENKYKARIKILVRTLGVDEMRRQVEAEWENLRDGYLLLQPEDIERFKAHFPQPEYDAAAAEDKSFEKKLAVDPAFATWVQHNVKPHRVPGYRAAVVTLKDPEVAPGDATAEQMDLVADLADEYSLGELRVLHEQNLLLTDVPQGRLFELWQKLSAQDLATPNAGALTDMICCPGLDFCSLANAGSIGVAYDLNQRFDDLDYLYDIGELRLNMSGCMNGCGHHSVGHIGILGVDKKGEEWYQVSLGGSSKNDAALGDRLGAALPRDRIVDAIDEIVKVFVEHREGDERFLDTYRRIGLDPFKSRVYADRGRHAA